MSGEEEEGQYFQTICLNNSPFVDSDSQNPYFFKQGEKIKNHEDTL